MCGCVFINFNNLVFRLFSAVLSLCRCSYFGLNLFQWTIIDRWLIFMEFIFCGSVQQIQLNWSYKFCSAQWIGGVFLALHFGLVSLVNPKPWFCAKKLGEIAQIISSNCMLRYTLIQPIRYSSINIIECVLNFDNFPDRFVLFCLGLISNRFSVNQLIVWFQICFLRFIVLFRLPSWFKGVCVIVFIQIELTKYTSNPTKRLTKKCMCVCVDIIVLLLLARRLEKSFGFSSFQHQDQKWIKKTI